MQDLLGIIQEIGGGLSAVVIVALGLFALKERGRANQLQDKLNDAHEKRVDDAREYATHINQIGRENVEVLSGIKATLDVLLRGGFGGER